MKTQAPKQPAAPAVVVAPLVEVAGEPYTAYQIPHDRLGRYAVLGNAKGGGKPIVAVNIRSAAVADLLASAPTMRDKLMAISMQCNGTVAGSSASPASAAQLASEILAIINPPPVVAAK